MEFVDLHAQYLTIKEEIDAAVASVIRESAFIRGRHVEDFEHRFANLTGAKYCVSCGNGTDAIYIALKGLGLRSGDEVITSAHSWISSSETVTQAGGEIVFCDTEEPYYCIDPARLEANITSRTKGIIAVHLYGQPADMDSILEIARRHDLWIIEDCAQAHLATYKGRQVGTLGDVGAFSFYPGKNLGAMGDAGCIITNRDDVAEYATLFARHGGKGTHTIEGINSRLDGLQAAILNVKIPHLQSWTERRRSLATFYDHLLSDVPGISTPTRRPDSEHVFHLYVIRSADREGLRAHLERAGIPTVINYPKALPFYPAYSRLNHVPEDFPIASSHQEVILSIPLYPEMGEENIRRVANEIQAYSVGTV